MRQGLRIQQHVPLWIGKWSIRDNQGAHGAQGCHSWWLRRRWTAMKTIILAPAAVQFSAIVCTECAMSQFEWTKDQRNPVMTGGPREGGTDAPSQLTLLSHAGGLSRGSREGRVEREAKHTHACRHRRSQPYEGDRQTHGSVTETIRMAGDIRMRKVTLQML